MFFSYEKQGALCSYHRFLVLNEHLEQYIAVILDAPLTCRNK